MRTVSRELLAVFGTGTDLGTDSVRASADPFSLGDAAATTEMLERAGFDAVRLKDVHEPVLYGHDIDAAHEFVCGFQDVTAALAGMSRDDATHAVDRLRHTLEEHHSEDQGVAFDSRSWLITARRH